MLEKQFLIIKTPRALMQTIIVKAAAHVVQY